jgi:hypothetical protein
MSEPKNINVNIPNVISWFEESEQCMLHNHAEIIPTTKSVMLDLIDKIKHASMTNSDYDAIVLKESIETLRKVVQNSYDKPLFNPFDEVHNYVILINKKSIEAEQLRDAAEADGNSNYDYWDGYLAALDFAIDSLPNYNN